jgi:hypothetical protein
MPEKRVILLKTDGITEVLTPSEKPSLEQMQKWVGGYIEPVRHNVWGKPIRYKGQIVTMVLNEEGSPRNLPFNAKATMLYEGRIFGDVLLLQGWKL